MAWMDFLKTSADSKPMSQQDPGDWLAARDPTDGSKGIKDNANAQESLGDVKAAYAGINAPKLSPVDYQGPERAADATASTVGPSAMGGVTVNQEGRQAQVAQLAALKNLQASGGMTAADKANLSGIEANENQNAKGQRDAILQNANARGQGGSGASLLAQLTGSQGAVDRQSAQDMNVAGMAQNRSLQAGQNAAALGSSLEGQDFNEQAQKAQASDAIDRFNAGNRTGVSEFNTQKNQGVNNAAAAAQNAGQTMNNYQIPEAGFGNEMGIAGGKAGAAGTGLNYYGGKYKEDVGAQNNGIGGLIKLGGAAMSSMAWGGGKVGGIPSVPGDSPHNDKVPVLTSPKEVIVPRTLAEHGTKDAIGHFVQHAGPISPLPTGDKRREAMLSALKNMRGHI